MRRVSIIGSEQAETARRYRGTACSAWEKTPQQLAALCPEAHPADLFARLQRPWTWNDAGPNVSKKLRVTLEEVLGFDPPMLDEVHASADGSRKLVFRFSDGARAECIHMPRAVQQGRVTLCISSQVGCAMGCTFCATAQMGLKRNLSAGEIVGQVLVTLRNFGPRHPGELALVFMGMGEPLHNFANVVHAVQILCEASGLGLSPRRITVSTSGLIPQIIALGQIAPRPLLAVSLNATTEEQRRELMPIGQRHSLAELRRVLEAYPVRTRERITLEYVLLAGVNDTLPDARRLAEFGAAFPHHINLIPFNEHPGSAFRAPSEHHIATFARTLLATRPTILTVRRSRGQDISGACGQLAQN